MRWLPAIDAFSLLLAYGCIHRYAPYCSLGLLLDSFLGLRRPVPMAQQESSLLYLLLEIIPGIHLDDMLIPEFQGFCINIRLYLIQKRLYPLPESLLRSGDFLKSVTAGKLHGAVLHVTRADGHSANLNPGRRVSRSSIFTECP